MKSSKNTTHKFGWKKQLDDFRDFKFDLKVSKLPTSVDLRSQCPPVYDQLQLGSCTANGIAGAIEFDLMKQKKSVYVPSRLEIYYNERVIEGTVNSDSGANIRDGIKACSKQGCCPETEWPYVISNFKKKPPAKCISDALKELITNYKALSSVNDYKTALASGYPVIFGFTVYSSFESDIVTKTGVVPMPGKNESVLGGHCVLMVGYDDSKSVFICRNSWGTSWGLNGYFLMPYAYFTAKLTSDFWVINTVA